jgi:hypothetical protein
MNTYCLEKIYNNNNNINKGIYFVYNPFILFSDYHCFFNVYVMCYENLHFKIYKID